MVEERIEKDGTGIENGIGPETGIYFIHRNIEFIYKIFN